VSDNTLKNILDDCFWEFDFTEKDVDNLVRNRNKKEQVFLFDKILVNSKQLLRSMEIFDKKDLEELIESYKIPKFNHHFSKRRLNMLEFYFLDKPLTVNELKWMS